MNATITANSGEWVEVAGPGLDAAISLQNQGAAEVHLVARAAKPATPLQGMACMTLASGAKLLDKTTKALFPGAVAGDSVWGASVMPLKLFASRA